MSFSKIAEYLKDKHQIFVRRQSIEKFLKVRARGFKPCKYAWAIETADTANQTITGAPSQAVSAAKEALKPPSVSAHTRAKELNVPVSHEHILTLRPKEERALRVAEIEALEAEEAAKRKQLKKN